MNVNVTKIERLSNGIIQFYNGNDVVDSFSITSSVSVLFENNLAKSISFVSNVKTLSFNVYNIQSVYGSTSNKIYSSGIDPSDTGSAYISRLYDIYAFIISDVIQGCCPGPTFVGGVVVTYPDYASFPATGQESVIYIDEATNQAYFWDGSSYQPLISVSSADKMITIGRNSTGSTLYKGTIIYISGSTGNRPNYVKAQANSEATSAGTFGVILSDIANNSDGYAVTIGTIDNLDTRSTAPNPFTSDTLVDGDTIYLSPTTAGYVTNVKPYAPDHLVYVGKVVRTSPTNGVIVYRIQNGYELDELHDVAAQTPSNNDGLFFESSTSLWKNKSISTVLGYTPFNLPSLTSGSVLFSNGTTIAQNNSNLFWDNTNNRFSVRSAGEASRGICQEDYSTSQGAAAIVFQKARGTFASPLDVNANDLVGACVFNARVGGAFTSNRALFGANMQTSTGMGMYFIAGATNNNYIPDLYIHQSGNILIGTTESVLTGITDAGFKLDVNGITMLRGIVYGVGSGGGAIQLLTTAGTGTAVIGGNTGTPLRVQGQNLQLLVGSTQVGLFHATTGNLLLQNGGTFTDAGYRLDVNGTARVQGQLNSQSIVPLADSTYNLGTSALRFNFLYLRGLSTTGNSLDINAGNINLNNDVGAIKARLIGATGNFLIGTTTDAGYRLDVNGSVRTTGSISAASAVARGTYLNQTLVATANNDTLYGLDIFPTFNTGSFTGVNSVAMRIRNASGNIFYLDSVGNATLGASLGVGSIYSSTNMNFSSGSGDLRLQSNFNANTGLTMFRNTRNFVIQDGGTFTDAGYRLDVQGTSRFTGAATFNNNMAIGGTLAVGTFTTAVASAQLEVVSTTKGFLPPRGTNAQMLAIASPAAGLIFYDTTNNKLNCYDGTTWQPCW